MNPFSYGGIVGNGEFCNRTRELADLTEAMKSAGRCFVYAEPDEEGNVPENDQEHLFAVTGARIYSRGDIFGT